MKYHQFLSVKALFITLFLCISSSSVIAVEKNESANHSIEQSILKHYQQVLLNSYEYYSKKFGFIGFTAPNTIHNFPVLIENNIEFVVQQDFHTELFFSDVHEKENEAEINPKIVSTKTQQNIIRISNIPVDTGYLSSKFGIRKDPFHGTRRMHKGIDIAAKSGSPVSPLGKGTVVFSGYRAGFGNLVEIKHGNTVLTRYAHLKQLLVNKGQKVSVGDKIGLVGTSGRSTGPHLHLEVLFNDKQVDPQIFLANHFGSNGNTLIVTKVKTKLKTINISKLSVAKKEITKAPKTVEKRVFPKVSDYPQISYQDYVESVDGLFGFSAPESSSR